MRSLTLAAALVCALTVSACTSPATTGESGQSATSAAPAPTRPSSADLAPALSGIAIPGNELAFAESGTLPARLDEIAQTGATWLRIDIPWTHVSWQSGQFDWSPYDAVVAGARERGLLIVGVLGTLAPHVRGGADWTQGPSSPEQHGGFVDYARTAATRYAGQVSAWEVWNEPNLDQSWSPRPNVADYARLFIDVEAVVRPACGGCLILLGGTGGATDAADIDTLSWYRALVATSAPARADGAAIHPYSDMVTGAGGEMSLAAQIVEILDTAGYSRLRLWGTEVGAPTAGSHAVDEATAVRLMWQADQAWAAVPNAGPLFWYTMYDRSPAPSQARAADEDREYHFGLLRTDGTAKPAFDEFVRLNAR